MEDITFKVCIFGDSGVGKTTLVKRYMLGVYDPNYKITVGADFYTKKVKVDDKSVSLQIWDFAGEKQFRFILPAYARGSAGGIFMYDTTRQTSLENLEEWLNVFTKGTSKETWEVPIIMVGAKLDLQQVREVDINEATDLATKHDLASFLECSSKTGENVEQIFTILTRNIMEKRGIL